MSAVALNTQIGLFVIVSLIYIGFTFGWAWYKGRQEETEFDRSDPNHRSGNGGTN